MSKSAEIQIETPQMSKNAGNSNWNSLNVKKCGKIQIEIPHISKCATDVSQI